MNEIRLTSQQQAALAVPLALDDGVARSITLEPSPNGLRVKGWIGAKDKRAAFLACKELAAVFQRESVGAWIDGEGEINAPFEFDMPREQLGEQAQAIATRAVSFLADAHARPQSDAQLIARCDPSVRHRRAVELEIVHRVIRDLRAAGYELRADDGESAPAVGSEQELINVIFSVDEATIRTRKTGARGSFVFLVGGNGADIISDDGISLEAVMEPISKWIEEQQDAGKF